VLVREPLRDAGVLRLLDFDRDVVGIAVQPFVLHFRDDEGRTEHTPDVFARLADGTGKVIDIRPRVFAGSDDFLRKCAATRAACRAAGWDFEVVDGIDPIFEANVDWLAGCRHELVDPLDVAPSILATCVRNQPFGALVEAFGPASLTRPVLCHLLWTGRLVADLSRPLGDATTVATSDASERRRAS
jgi:putative transposase